jgi:hypothetical protein
MTSQAFPGFCSTQDRPDPGDRAKAGTPCETTQAGPREPAEGFAGLVFPV